MMSQVKPILSVMAIVIAMYIWTILYCYWLRLSKILCGRAIDMPYKIALYFQMSQA